MLDALQANNRMVINMIDTYNRSLEQTVVRLGGVFAGNYGQAFSLDANGVLHHGSETISMENTAIPNRFTAQAQVAATVLTRQGSDFVRTFTSIKDDSGQRAAGVPLGPPASGGCQPAQGERYSPARPGCWAAIS